MRLHGVYPRFLFAHFSRAGSVSLDQNFGGGNSVFIGMAANTSRLLILSRLHGSQEGNLNTYERRTTDGDFWFDMHVFKKSMYSH